MARLQYTYAYASVCRVLVRWRACEAKILKPTGKICNIFILDTPFYIPQGATDAEGDREGRTRLHRYVDAAVASYVKSSAARATAAST